VGKEIFIFDYKKMRRKELERILNKSINNFLSRDEIIYLLSLDGDEMEILFSYADKMRKKYVGDEIHLRGIIEFSNYCKNNCKYCGLRKDNKNLKRYRMEIEEIIETAKYASKLGFKTIVLQSGEDMYFDVDKICKIIKGIKNSCDVAVTLCIGERSYSEYKEFRKAGADRYLLKHETVNKKLFEDLRPGTKYENRIKCLYFLKELGYQVGSGNIVGLPGQTIEDLADDILLLKKLNVDMAGIGPFIPHPDTPLGNFKEGSLFLTLKVLAVARIVLKYPHLPATTAIGTISQDGRQRALKSGANVIMPNVTPLKYRVHYQIYPNKICVYEDADKCRNCVEKIVKSLGRKISRDYGDSLYL
jgi:biotin synthase